jgi:hypothetical protein
MSTLSSALKMNFKQHIYQDGFWREFKLHFSALDALKAWKKEALPSVEVPKKKTWSVAGKQPLQLCA